MNSTTPPQIGDTHPILCFYRNTSCQLQIARIANIANWYFERVIFPGQQLLFEALPEAQLEIYRGSSRGAMLSERIACHLLQVDEGVEERIPALELAS